MKTVLFALVIVALAGSAPAQMLTADGLTARGIPGPPATRDRLGLVNDGSFEFGECEAGSAWTCTTDTECSWIINPVPIWGYAAYEGELCAWLGGYCGPLNSNSFCQDLFIDGILVDWYWMGYGGPGIGSLTIDGATVWRVNGAPHTYGTWNSASATWGEVDVSTYCGQTVNLCFEWSAIPNAAYNGSLLIDLVTLSESCATSVESVSMSTVKAAY